MHIKCISMFGAKTLYKRESRTSDMDSVKLRRSKLYSKDKDVQLLERCEALWMNLDSFRQQRARGIRFCYGDQWADPIEINGRVMTYREYLKQKGNVVLQTNQIKNRVETIAGVEVSQQNDPVCHAADRKEQPLGEVVTEAMQANCEMNIMQSLYKKFVKELNLGGLAVAYESYDNVTHPSHRLDSWTQYISPGKAFFDMSGADPRLWDISIAGRYYYGSFQDICAQFARKASDYDKLRQIYANQSVVFKTEETRDYGSGIEVDDDVFMRSDDPTRCYVCEVWTKETRPRIRLWDMNDGSEEIIDYSDNAYRRLVRQENESRRALALASGWKEEDIPYIVGDGFGRDQEEKSGFFVDTFWYCRFLAPDGSILWEGESPYADRSHPFSFCIFPYIDGKIVGYMSDTIDHNMAINRAVILHDWLLRTQAKGVTVVPKAIVPDDVSYEEFARSWTSIDDMVFIDMKPGQEKLMPKTFFGSAQTFDVAGLIATYSRLMESGSPVNGALQGKAPTSGTSGVLYEQMANNAATSIAALMDDFHVFQKDILYKKMKNIVSFYDIKRFEEISGNMDTIYDMSQYNLGDIRNLECDLRIRPGAGNTLYQETQEADLRWMLENQFITFDEYTELSRRPYIDKLRQKRQAAQAEQEQTQVMTSPSQTALPPDVQPAMIPQTPVSGA